MLRRFCARYCGSIAVLSLSLLVASSGSATVSAFDNLFVFGDSIVDAGNTQALAIGFGAPDPTPASSGYYQGRFSNGINPADVVNIAVEGVQSVRSTAGGDNWSFGGARARTDGDPIPDLTSQVNSFISGHGGHLDGQSLYMINVGGNDVRDILLGGLTGAARQAVIDGAVAAIQTSISSLKAAGAQNILFVGVGDVGSIPEQQSPPGTPSAAGRQASLDMNAAIQAGLPAGVMYFNTIGLTDQIALDPTAFGLPAVLNTTNPCVGTAAATACTGYVFWDNVHPTTAIEQILGNALVAFVPEPGTASLLVIGLIGIGVRRRARC